MTTPAGADDRNRQERGERRRQDILDAAAEMFAEKGYRGTDVADIAERVGMTSNGMMYYFGSKQRLLEEVVAERGRQELAQLSPDVTLRDFRILGRHSTESPLMTRLYLVLLMENLDPGEPLHDFFVQRLSTLKELLRTLLQRARADGEVRDDIDVEAVVAEIVAVFLGAEVQWVLDPTSIDLDAVVRHFIDELVGSLAP